MTMRTFFRLGLIALIAAAAFLWVSVSAQSRPLDSPLDSPIFVTVPESFVGATMAAGMKAALPAIQTAVAEQETPTSTPTPEPTIAVTFAPPSVHRSSAPPALVQELCLTPGPTYAEFCN